MFKGCDPEVVFENGKAGKTLRDRATWERQVRPLPPPLARPVPQGRPYGTRADPEYAAPSGA